MIGVLVAVAIVCLVVMVIDELELGGCLAVIAVVGVLALLLLAL